MEGGFSTRGERDRETFIDGIASCTGHFTKCFSEVNSEKLCHTCWLHTVSHYNAATSCRAAAAVATPMWRIRSEKKEREKNQLHYQLFWANSTNWLKLAARCMLICLTIGSSHMSMTRPSSPIAHFSFPPPPLLAGNFSIKTKQIRDKKATGKTEN